MHAATSPEPVWCLDSGWTMGSQVHTIVVRVPDRVDSEIGSSSGDQESSRQSAGKGRERRHVGTLYPRRLSRFDRESVDWWQFQNSCSADIILWICGWLFSIIIPPALCWRRSLGGYVQSTAKICIHPVDLVLAPDDIDVLRLCGFCNISLSQGLKRVRMKL